MQRIRSFFTHSIGAHVAGFAGMTLMKIIGGLLIIKLMAVQLGPENFGVLGQLMGLVGIVSMLAGGGTTNGLITLLSRKENTAAHARTLGAAIQIYLISSTAVSVLLVGGSIFLANTLLAQPSLAWIFWLLALTQWLVGASNLLQGLLSVHDKVNWVVRLNIIGIAIGTTIFVALIHRYGFTGAAIGLVLFPAATGVVGCMTGLLVLPPNQRRSQWSGTASSLHDLLSYALVTLVTITAVPTAQLVVRHFAGTHAGWDAIGYWQGVIKISDVYMQFIGMLLIYVALPRFSAQTNTPALKREVAFIRTPLLLCTAAGLLLAWALRDVVIAILFSDSFTPARDYFLPQVLGDFMRITGLIAVYTAISRGARHVAIAYELTQACLLVGLTHYLLASLQGMAPAYAHLGASAGAMLMALVLCRRSAHQWFSASRTHKVTA